MKLKRFASLALSLCLVLCSFAVVATAATPTVPSPVDFSGAGTAGYSAPANIEIPDVPDILELTAVGDCKITSPAGLAKLSEITNNGTVANRWNFRGYTVYLAADLDMSAYSYSDFAPIGNWTWDVGAFDNTIKEQKFFGGVFEGCGHKISNLKLVAPATEDVKFVSLFGVLCGGAVRNLVIDESCEFTNNSTSAQSRTGLIAYVVSHGAMLVSSVSGSEVCNLVENVQNNANVSAAAGYVGGIAAVATPGTGHRTVIKNCTQNGAVSGGATCAGILGSLYGRNAGNRAAFVVACKVNGAVTSDGTVDAIATKAQTGGTLTLTGSVDAREELGQIQAQAKAGAIRFVGVINSLQLDAVGFEVTATYGDNVTGTKKFETDTVYTSVLANVNGVEEAVTAADLEGDYLFALTLTDINVSGNVTFTVRSYKVDNGGIAYGETATFVYNNGAIVTE